MHLKRIKMVNIGTSQTLWFVSELIFVDMAPQQINKALILLCAVESNFLNFCLALKTECLIKQNTKI